MTPTFEEMYQEYQPHVFRFVMSLLHSHEQAEDITQETFVRAWRAHGRLLPNSNILGWLFTIARRIVIDTLRPKHLATMPLEACYDLIGQEDIAETHAMIADISHILTRLPEKYREALVLSYVEGISERDIAEKLGVSRGVVRMRLVRGRNQFKASYGRWKEVA